MSGGVFLNIDRIVLEGFDHIDRRALATALQRALAEQLASSSPGRSSATPFAQTHITLQRSFNAAQLGQSLATELCRIIGNTVAADTTKPGIAHGADSDA